MRLQLLNIIVALSLSMLSMGCGGNATTTYEVKGDTLTSEARLLTIVDCGVYTLVDVENPWEEGTLLHRYALIPRDSVTPENVPENATIVQVPVNSALVYSSVHAGAIKELGCVGVVKGVVDAEYYKITEIIEGIASGAIVDAGSSMAPSIEKIVELSPDAIFSSPFQNAGHGAIEKLGIPIIECADYMEATPLGRAEWIKLIGELLCCRKEATEVYSGVVEEYNMLASKVKDVKEKPVVISEMVIDGVWFVPGGRSYAAQIYADAGANYPWSDDETTGSLQLDFATVYDKAHDADFWVIKSHEPNVSLQWLEAKYPLNKKMKAFANGGVYVIKTKETSFYEDFPFHPERLLREYILLFHPEVLDEGQSFNYLHQIK